MSDRPSKKERGRLRQAYKQAQRDADSVAIVFSSGATFGRLPPKVLVGEARRLSVNLAVRHVSGLQFSLSPPHGPSAVGTQLFYGTLTEELSADLISLEEMRDLPTDIPLGAPCIAVSTKTRMHPANALIHMTLLRVLGRLTHGTLADLDRGFIMDDWLTWSLDSMDRDMFRVRLAYDPEPADVKAILAEIPSLRRRRLWPFF